MRSNIHAIQCIFSTLMSIALLFLLNACSSSGVTHQTYNYGNFSCPSNAAIQPDDAFVTLSLHVQSQLDIKWKPLPGQLSTETTPSPVNLSAVLLGPFSSLGVAKQINPRDTFNTPNSLSASIPLIQTNDWTNKTYTSTIKLSPGLISGYYVQIQRVDSTTNKGAGSNIGTCILKITP